MGERKRVVKQLGQRAIECIHNQWPWVVGPIDMTGTWSCPNNGVLRMVVPTEGLYGFLNYVRLSTKCHDFHARNPILLYYKYST